MKIKMGFIYYMCDVVYYLATAKNADAEGIQVYNTVFRCI